jgi:glycosyltransferase involved in cell wall biosynthesis
MKILYLSQSSGIPILGRKGASVHIRELVAAFARAGHSVAVASSLLHKSPWESPANVGVPLIHIPEKTDEPTLLAIEAFNQTVGTSNSLPKEVRYILHNQEVMAQLHHRLRSNPPDFIYERASLFGIAGVLVARQLNVPLILELNAPLTKEQETYRQMSLTDLATAAESWALAQADAVLAVSSQLRDHAISLGADPGRVRVLPNGVDPGLFNPAIPPQQVRHRWGLHDGPILGFVGGLRPWHDLKALPPLLHRLIQRYAQLQMVIVGDGPMRIALENDFKSLGIREQVVFTGSVPHEEIPELIRLFDVAVAPYTHLDHAFYFSPLKLFEYMACGVPVVGARVGQLVEVIRHGETGLLYDAGDIDDLAGACDRLLKDESLRRHMGAMAAKDALEHYTWDRNAELVTELARSLSGTRSN